MTAVALSPHCEDEFAALAGRRRLTVGMVALASVWTLVVTGVDAPGRPLPALSVVALLLFAAVGFVVVRASAPLRLPFSSRSHASAHAMLIAAGFSQAGVDGGADGFVRGDWVPVALGLVVVAVSPHRPAPELARFTAVSALLVGVSVFLGGLPENMPADARDVLVAGVLSALVSLTPALALALAAVVYSREIEVVAALRRRQPAPLVLTDELRGRVARSVHRERMAVLGGDVSPFLRHLLGTGSITGPDRERARELATSLRGALVAEADRSWLDDLLVRELDLAHPLRFVDDPDRTALAMDESKRTALRAILACLGDCPAGVSSASLTLSATRGGATGAITVLGDDPARVVRWLGPYLSVMRGAFDRVSTDLSSTEVIVRFDYDQN